MAEPKKRGVVKKKALGPKLKGEDAKEYKRLVKQRAEQRAEKAAEVKKRADKVRAQNSKKIVIDANKSKGPGTLQQLRNKLGYTPERKAKQEKERRATVAENESRAKAKQAEAAKNPKPLDAVKKSGVTTTAPKNVAELAAEAKMPKPAPRKAGVGADEYMKMQQKAAAGSPVQKTPTQKVVEGGKKALGAATETVAKVSPRLLKFLTALGVPAAAAAGVADLLTREDPTGGSDSIFRDGTGGSPTPEQRAKFAGMDFYARGGRGLPEEAQAKRAGREQEYKEPRFPPKKGLVAKKEPENYPDFDEGSSGQFGFSGEEDTAKENARRLITPKGDVPSKVDEVKSGGSRTGHTINIHIGADGQAKLGNGSDPKPQDTPQQTQPQAKPKAQQGGNFPVYNKNSAEAAEFRRMFAESRKKGLPDFIWNGRKYNTKVRGE